MDKKAALTGVILSFVMIVVNHADRKHFDGQATLAELKRPPPAEGLFVVI